MKTRRSRIYLALLAAACCLAFGAIGTGTQTASAGTSTGCSPGYVCGWWNIYWTGAVGYTLCTGGAHPLNQFKGSGSNDCANKASWLRVNGNANDCLNPGGRRAVAEFNEIWIGAEGSRC